jgi:hypothetical protein
MVTYERRVGVSCWDIRRNGILLLTLMRRMSKEGVEYYDWTTGAVVGVDLDTICADLTKEMNKYAGNGEANVRSVSQVPPNRVLSLRRGGRSSVSGA